MSERSSFRIILLILVVAFSLPGSSTLFAQDDFSELFRKVNPSVVVLRVFDSLGTPRGQGSGFFVSQDGLIVTCYHVVDRAEIMLIKTSDGTKGFSSSIIAVDPESDLAVIQCKELGAEALSLAGEKVQPGKPIVVIGSPLGMNNTISTGIISGIRSEGKYQGRIQFTNPISGGSSGGPLLNAESEVLGVVTSTEPAGQNINFGTPVESIQALLKEMDVTKPFKEFSPVTKEIREKIEGGQETRASIVRECAPEDVQALDEMIGEAISVGVDVYNEGNPMGCFRIYEGAGYKILNKLGNQSQAIRSTLEKSLNSINETMPVDAKAWIMRAALDTLLGEATQTL